jgi:Protein of unknown function (DUF1573)
MKQYFFAALAALMILAACKNEDKNADIKKDGTATTNVIAASKDSANFTSIEWLDSVNQKFAGVKEGTSLEVSYRFKNSGSKPLVIESVNASCGCTVPERPEKPIAPGEEGIIKAKFDSKGRVGTNAKTLTVLANVNNSPVMLMFTAEVEAAK